MAKQKTSGLGGIVSTLLEGVHDLSRSETIIGEPQQTGGATVIPVHRLRVTFGAGTTSAGAHGEKLGGDTSSYGAAGVVDLDPVAAITVGADGKAQLLTVESDSLSTWSNLIGDIPDLVTKVARIIGDRIDKSAAKKLAKSEPTKLPETAAEEESPT